MRREDWITGQLYSLNKLSFNPEMNGLRTEILREKEASITITIPIVIMVVRLIWTQLLSNQSQFIIYKTFNSFEIEKKKKLPETESKE